MLKKLIKTLKNVQNKAFFSLKSLWVRMPGDLQYMLISSVLYWFGFELIALGLNIPAPPVYVWFGGLLIIDTMIGNVLKIVKDARGGGLKKK